MTAEEEKAKVRREWYYWLKEIEESMDEKPEQWYSAFVKRLL